MVGSVLMQRMVEEKTDLIEPCLLQHISSNRYPCPCFRWQSKWVCFKMPLSIDSLKQLLMPLLPVKVAITLQKVYPALRQAGLERLLD
ncbi:hypothetical protein O9929_10145 [Vibrio lentus]|nr:hypothetical protein [Vibrio lentus]